MIRTSIDRDTERLLVTIGRPPGDSRPPSHRRIDQLVEEQVGRDVPTGIRVILVAGD